MLTNEQLLDLNRIMTLKYAAYLRDRSFEITAKLETESVYCSIVLRNDDKSFYYLVESRMDMRPKDLTGQDAALIMIDYMDIYFDEYLREDENVMLPIDWTSFSCEGVEFELRGQIHNLKLELEADALLAAQDAH